MCRLEMLQNPTILQSYMGPQDLASRPRVSAISILQSRPWLCGGWRCCIILQSFNPTWDPRIWPLGPEYQLSLSFKAGVGCVQVGDVAKSYNPSILHGTPESGPQAQSISYLYPSKQDLVVWRLEMLQNPTILQSYMGPQNLVPRPRVSAISILQSRTWLCACWRCCKILQTFNLTWDPRIWPPGPEYQLSLSFKAGVGCVEVGDVAKSYNP